MYANTGTTRKIKPLPMRRAQRNAEDTRKRNVKDFAARLVQLSNTFPQDSPMRAYIQYTASRPKEIAVWWENAQWETYPDAESGQNQYQDAMIQWNLSLEAWATDPTMGLSWCYHWLAGCGVQFNTTAGTSNTTGHDEDMDVSMSS